jgi:hypothetical protein
MMSLLHYHDLTNAIESTPYQACECTVGLCASWESVPEERWPVTKMQKLGTLRDPELYEPTFEEFHPDGTHYDSPEAPIAIGYFPYNRCDVFKCTPCGRVLLRYTEFGGYYIDHRVRWAATRPVPTPVAPAPQNP